MKTTRGELFQAVWAAPVTHLAKEHGLSDVGLAKVCRARGIPLPPRGYWARLAAGQAIPKPALEGNPDEIVEFYGQPSMRRKALPTEIRERVSDTVSAVKRQPPTELQPWTRKTLSALSRKADRDGFIRSWQPDTFRVLVSEASRSRVIDVLNTLELSLAQLGFAWEPSEKQSRVVGALHGEVVVFEIRERYNRQEHTKRHPKHRWMDETTYSYSFLGELVVRIDGYYEGRKSWGCGKTKTLEEKLPEIVEGFVGAAEALRKRALEQRERRRKIEEDIARREERARIAREEKAFLEAVLKEATAWSNASLLRRYIAHLQATAEREKFEPPEKSRKWLERVERSVDRLDPTGMRLSLWAGSSKPEAARLEEDADDDGGWGDEDDEDDGWGTL